MLHPNGLTKFVFSAFLLLWLNVAANPVASTAGAPGAIPYIVGAGVDPNFRFQYGYIDRSLQFVIGPQPVNLNYQPQEFSDGVAWMFRGYKNRKAVFALVDTQGHEVFAMNGGWAASQFSNGVSKVNQSWFINKFGQVSRVVPDLSIEYPPGQKPPDEPVLPELASQWKAAEPDLPEWYRPGMEQTYGSADYSTSPPTFNRNEDLYRGGCGYAPRRKYRSFSEGLLNVVASTDDKKTHQCYIDKDSRIVLVLPPNILAAGDFHDGLAPIAVAANEIKQTRPPSSEIQRFLLGFIDKSGKIVIAPKFLLPLGDPSIHVNFDHGVAVVRFEDCDAVIDNSGNILKKFRAGSLRDFHDGLARLEDLADKEGNILDHKDSSHGIQNEVEYKTAVTKLVQDRLKDLNGARLVRFSVVPNQLRPVETYTPIKMVPAIVTLQQSSLGHDQQTESDYQYGTLVQQRLQSINLPMRTFNLYNVRMNFLLQKGQVRLEPSTENRGEMD
jgi:hypothetical protein